MHEYGVSFYSSEYSAVLAYIHLPFCNKASIDGAVFSYCYIFFRIDASFKDQGISGFNGLYP
ncbi:hypothetical protein SDC9_146259 [bioreactor metagenome]|uniref:Uncharacterized protein n=1 Tax=bioreactor metagenome TaxID=1076179 RepID=A0A645ECL4_9ZZZZ